VPYQRASWHLQLFARHFALSDDDVGIGGLSVTSLDAQDSRTRGGAESEGRLFLPSRGGFCPRKPTRVGIWSWGLFQSEGYRPTRPLMKLAGDYHKYGTFSPHGRGLVFFKIPGSYARQTKISESAFHVTFQVIKRSIEYLDHSLLLLDSLLSPGLAKSIPWLPWTCTLLFVILGCAGFIGSLSPKIPGDRLQYVEESADSTVCRT
jgi:hypothetical protein